MSAPKKKRCGSSLTVTGDSLQQMVQEWAPVASTVPEKMAQRMKRWLLILACWQRESIMRLRPEHRCKPRVTVHQSDGWSAFVESREVSMQNGRHRLVRCGRTKKEFLVEGTIVKYMEGDRLRARIITTPARPLDEVIPCWNMFTAATEHLEVPMS